MFRFSVAQWLVYIESLHPQAIALGIDRVQQVAHRLKIDTLAKKVITVAGTNGKGSCVAFLEAILTAAHYKVGCYTSPHLLTYNERIRIEGQQVADAALCSAFEEVEVARQQTALTYFEFGTLAAFILLAKAQLDLVILEVGLGGRLDAVNIINPDVAVVTTLDLDHQAWLGKDRESIGKEKAGIFRSQRPAVCGDKQAPLSLIEYAQQIGAIYYQRDQHFWALPNQANSNWTWRGQINESLLELEALPLPQLNIDNAVTAIQALQCLNLSISRAAIGQGLVSTRLAGRLQWVSNNPPTLLDVAHNPQAGRHLAQYLAQHPIEGKTRVVVAMLEDKDCFNTLVPLLPLVETWYLAGLAVARGQTGKNLSTILLSYNQSIAAQLKVYATVVAAYQAAVAASDRNDRIVVFGSFYTVAAIMKYLKVGS